MPRDAHTSSERKAADHLTLNQRHIATRIRASTCGLAEVIKARPAKVRIRAIKEISMALRSWPSGTTG